MRQTLLNRLNSRGRLSYPLTVLSFALAACNLPGFTYTDFNSTNGLSLVGASAAVAGALRLTPAVKGVVGTAWAIAKQPCSGGFDTQFRFRISNSGSMPGTPPGADGILFTIQKNGPTDPISHGLLSPADGSVSVFFNTFWNWPDSTDFTKWDVSGNSVGVLSNALYLGQVDLTPRGLNLEDSAVHNARIAFDGLGLTVWLDGVMLLTNILVPGMASAVDADGKAWVGFGSTTGWAWENHDILSWSFEGSFSNRAPVAVCTDVIVSAGMNCMSDASVNNGSFDPDGDPITLKQVPPGPYPLGTNLVTLTVADDKGLSNSCSALVIVLDNLPPLTYTNFNSTNGLSVVGASAAVDGALRLTPAVEGVVGTAWAITKQPCSGGFDTQFQFRISNSGSRPGTPSGADGILFTIQKNGPADSISHGLLSPADGSVSVFFNTFWNWPDSTDFTKWDVSGNSVGVLSNALYLGQTDLTPRGINLEDGAVHLARIAFDGAGLTVWLDGLMLLTNILVPGMASAADADGKAWVGFGSTTGWAWENHDILTWSFVSSSCNRAPVAQCTNMIVAAGAECQADASVNNGSFDPDGDPITVSQVPPGPYPLGTNLVNLVVTDNHGASNACSALVIVQDRTPPVIVCASNKVVECGAAWSFDEPVAFDNCSPSNLWVSIVSTVTNAGCGGALTTTRTWQAVDGFTNVATCSQTVTVLDTTPPTIVCPASMAVEFQDETGAVVPFVVTASDVCSPVSVVVTPPSGSRFPIGVTPVQATAVDGCSNASQCGFALTVLGAQGVKSNVLAELIALRAGTTLDGSFAVKFDYAIEHLQASLNPAYWVDQTHLQPKSGNTAMNEEKLAAKELAEILEAKDCPVVAAALQGFIDRIVKCDRLLAMISIQEAAKAGLNAKKVVQDYALVAKGDREAEAGHYANAIEHYRNAWRHALQLQLQVGLNADGSAWLHFVDNGSKSYLIEVSTDLVNWVSLGTCTANGNGDVEFTDLKPAPQQFRFYRVLEQ